MKKHLTLLGVAAVATAVLAGCSNDELVESYQGEEISFRTRVETRATETTLGNLAEFKVWGDAKGYSTFFLTGGTATKDPEHDTSYNLTTKEGNKVYWPSGVDKIDFWAYAPSDISITPNINTTTQQLNGYTPEANVTNGGKNHKDLIVAHAEAYKAQQASIPLVFKHALSNISLKLQSGDGTKMMRVKGAWFVNAKNTGDITFVNDDNPINWSITNAKDECYGVTFGAGEIPMVNNVAKSAIIDRENKSTDLMLIPQEIKGLVFSADGTVATKGSYILLLCQILQVHPGAIHVEEGTSTVADDEKHYHQLFPEKSTVIESGNDFTNEFGYTCVPVDFSWKAGKKYIYTLEFCGKTSGGGLYPPTTLPDDLPGTGEDIVIVERPNTKKPGDPVLDKPISFTVDVEKWSEAKEEGAGEIEKPMQ